MKKITDEELKQWICRMIEAEAAALEELALRNVTDEDLERLADGQGDVVWERLREKLFGQSFDVK